MSATALLTPLSNLASDLPQASRGYPTYEPPMTTRADFDQDKYHAYQMRPDSSYDYFAAAQNFDPNTLLNYEDNLQEQHKKLHRQQRRQLRHTSSKPIARQGDLSSIAEGAAAALQVASLLFSLFNGGDSSTANLLSSLSESLSLDTSISDSLDNPDRIDTAAAAAAGSDVLDEELGTLMAFGGQYLRKTAIWAYEHLSATPSQPVGPPTSSSSVSTVSVSTTKSEHPLKQLSAPELEKLGLKAVSAGAKPLELQQAFASAQLNGDWTPLEKLISDALGPDAIPAAEPDSAPPSLLSSIASVTTSGGSTSSSTPAGSGSILDGLSSTVSQAGQILTKFVSGSSSNSVDKIGVAAGEGSTSSTTTTSQVNTGVAGTAQTYLQKFDKILNGDPNLKNPGPMDATVLTRFIKEFKLEKEALAIQNTLNQAVISFNHLVEGDDSKDPDTKIGSGSTSSNQGSSSTVVTGLLGSITSLPQTIAGAFGLASPSSNSLAQNKIDEGDQVAPSFATVAPVNTLMVGALGTAALGGVLWTMYVRDFESKRRRRVGSFYKKRSAHEADENDLGKLAETVLKGVKQFQIKVNKCNKMSNACKRLKQSSKKLVKKRFRDKYCDTLRKNCVKNIMKEFVE